MKKKIFISLLIIIASSIIGVYFYSLLTVKKLHSMYPVWDKKSKAYVLKNKKPKHWITTNQISKKALWAIVISEDWAFYQHKGLDFNQLQIVVEESLKEGKLVRGASTITQQVVKNSLLSSERSLVRKFKEMILSLMLENEFSKKKILETYINLIELGDGIYGVNKASYFYFKKHPLKLTSKEGAFLAMLLPSPKRYSQSFRKKQLTEYANEQVHKILGKLKIAKIITEEELHEQIDTPLSFEEKLPDIDALEDESEEPNLQILQE